MAQEPWILPFFFYGTLKKKLEKLVQILHKLYITQLNILNMHKYNSFQ